MAPAIPNIRPMILSLVNRSIPNATERINTNNGTMVSMIDPSIGEVFDKPYMMNTLRNTPINKAAPINLRLSLFAICWGRCHNKGINEKSAVTINEAETIAIGATYFPKIML